MAVVDIENGRFRTQQTDEIDYVKNGDLYIHARTSNILIGDEDDLDQLTGYTPGSIAHTAGYAKLWELDVDGETWVALLT